MTNYFNSLAAALFFALFCSTFWGNAQTYPWNIGGNTISLLPPSPYLGTLNRAPLCFITYNQPRMTILPEEKVGIGTVTPKTQLHLHSNSNNNLFLMTSAFTSDVESRGFIVRQEKDQVTLQQREKGLFNLFGPQNSGMTIVSNGYVGFGTALPQQKIHVVGENILISRSSTRAPGSPNGGILFGADVTVNCPSGVWGIEYLTESGTQVGGLNFWKTWTCTPNGFNYGLFLADNGRIGIGMPSPQRKLDVAGDVGATGLFVNHTATEDWSFAAQITVNRDLTKAFTVSHTTRGDVFRVYGNGIVNAKKIYAEAFEIHPNAMGINWFDHVFLRQAIHFVPCPNWSNLSKQTGIYPKSLPK
jgi:hypothetical protein